MPEATINGTTISYVESGEGVPCIALHGGLGYDHTYLSSTFGPLEGMHLVYPDQRGNGISGRPPLETITMQQLAEDVDALRVHLGLDNVAVLGHSYGGFVALEYAIRFPDRLTYLFCVDTSPGAFEPTTDELGERGDPSWVSPEGQAAGEAVRARFPTTTDEFRAALPMMAPTYVRSVPPDRFLDAVASTVLSVDALRRGMEILAGWSVVDALEKITCPTLVLCGRYDLHTTPECSRRLATAIPDAELVWFERSAHFPWLEEPDAFFGAIRDFLERHPL